MRFDSTARIRFPTGSARLLLPAAALALVAAPAAAAHVLARPSSLEAGRETTVTLVVPNERTSALETVSVRTPAGLRGWDVSVPPDGQAELAVRLSPPRAGTLTLRVTQRFADGSSENAAVRLRVEPPPAPPMRLGRALAVGAAGLAALAAFLVYRRRRPTLSGR